MIDNYPRCLVGENSPDWLILQAGYFPTKVETNGWLETDEPEVLDQSVSEDEYLVQLNAKEDARKARLDARDYRVASEKLLRASVAKDRQERGLPGLTRSFTFGSAVEAVHAAQSAGGKNGAKKRWSGHVKKSPNRMPPPGMMIAREAGLQLHYSATSISQGIKAGHLYCERKGKFCFVRLEDVKAYREEARYKTSPGEPEVGRRSRTPLFNSVIDYTGGSLCRKAFLSLRCRYLLSP